MFSIYTMFSLLRSARGRPLFTFSKPDENYLFTTPVSHRLILLTAFFKTIITSTMGIIVLSIYGLSAITKFMGNASLGAYVIVLISISFYLMLLKSIKFLIFTLKRRTNSWRFISIYIYGLILIFVLFTCHYLTRK